MDHNGDVIDDGLLSSVVGSVYTAGSDTVRFLRLRARVHRLTPNTYVIDKFPNADVHTRNVALSRSPEARTRGD